MNREPFRRPGHGRAKYWADVLAIYRWQGRHHEADPMAGQNRGRPGREERE